jgi:hypothetical protein
MYSKDKTFQPKLIAVIKFSHQLSVIDIAVSSQLSAVSFFGNLSPIMYSLIVEILNLLGDRDGYQCKQLDPARKSNQSLVLLDRLHTNETDRLESLRLLSYERRSRRSLKSHHQDLSCRDFVHIHRSA